MRHDCTIDQVPLNTGGEMNGRCNIWHVSEQSLRKKDSRALEASNGSRLFSEQSQKFKYGKAKSPEVCFPKLHVQCIEEVN